MYVALSTEIFYDTILRSVKLGSPMVELSAKRGPTNGEQEWKFEVEG